MFRLSFIIIGLIVPASVFLPINAFAQNTIRGVGINLQSELRAFDVNLNTGKRSKTKKISSKSYILGTTTIDPKSGTVASIGSSGNDPTIVLIPNSKQPRVYSLPKYLNEIGASVIDFRKIYIHPKTGEIFLTGRMVGNDGTFFYTVNIDKGKKEANLDPIGVSPYDRADSSGVIAEDGNIYWISTSSNSRSISKLSSKSRRGDVDYKTIPVTSLQEDVEFIGAVVPCLVTPNSLMVLVTLSFPSNGAPKTLRVYSVSSINNDQDAISNANLIYSTQDPKFLDSVSDRVNGGSGNISCAYGKVLFRSPGDYRNRGALLELKLKSKKVREITTLPYSESAFQFSIISNK